jgi:hypothetical protein
MGVNPRIPRLNKKSELVGPVAKAIVSTLVHEPEMMCVRNNGIFLLVKSASWSKESGGKGFLTLVLDDPVLHGIVNGGHTFAAIRQADEDPDRPHPWEAMIRLHVYEGIDKDLISDIAQGMNRSLQVDDASLEYLRGTFSEIKRALEGKSGENSIAYQQGELKDVDIQFVLTLMAMLNVDKFPDRKTHPNKLFGQPKLVLEEFVADADHDKIYRRMFPKLHEILVLSDNIQKEIASRFGRIKVKNSKTDNRVGSKKHKELPAHFAGGVIGGNVHLGWVYPMFAAFRANVDADKWAKGKFAWLENPFDLLESTADEMCDVVKQELAENNNKPAEVGRKEAAYRGCYSIVTMELAKRGKLTF